MIMVAQQRLYTSLISTIYFQENQLSNLAQHHIHSPLLLWSELTMTCHEPRA